MSTWLLIAALAVGTVALKSTGPLLAGGRKPPAPVERGIALLTPALVGALVIADTFTDGQSLMVGPRAAGLVVGTGALLLKLPVAVALVLGAATAALLRLLV